jgi:hypothetical protein
MSRRRGLFLNSIFVWIVIFSFLQPSSINFENDAINPYSQEIQQELNSPLISENGEPVLFDYFNTSLGYNGSLWNLESYGNGSVSWVSGEFINMSAKKHAYRTLSSKQTFRVGHEVNIRMKMQEAETIVCVGWTNQTATTGWNYLFWGNSVYIEGAQSTLLLTHKQDELPLRTFKQLPGIDASEFHDYQIVWNSSVIIAYIDGVRVGAIGGEMPEGPLHFKIAITENRNMDTEGWIFLDSIRILEHSSMITENPPFITLNSPGNRTLNLGSDPIDVIPVGSNGTLYWSWDEETNLTGAAPYDIRLPNTEGLHTLDVYCKDGYGYNNWDHVRYVFETMVAPPMVDAAWLSSTPSIDGVINSGEWSTGSVREYNLVRADGSVVVVNISVGCDAAFFYVAIDSPVPSGHDSRAAVIVTGYPDGHYHGTNETPVTSAYYTMGSPQAWEGYTELKFLGETSEQVIIQQKIEPIPSGFLALASEQRSHVHYEFRFPLSELATRHGDTLGISFMLFPTGMGVHSYYYPIAYPWANASKLALVRLPLPPDTILIQVGIVGAIGFVAVAIIFAYQRKSRIIETPGQDTEAIERIIGIIESYDKISIGRLSQMTNLQENETKQIVEQLITQKKLVAEIRDDEVIRGD